MEVVMKFRIEVTTNSDLPYKPTQYPAGMSPEEALTLEIEELSKDPRELLALDNEVVEITGVVVGYEPKRSPFSDLANRAAALHQPG
jgi:hypothetical protein